MLLALLISAAHAGQLAFSLGVAAGGGDAGGVSWSTAAPMTSVNYMTHLLCIEGWGGASSSLLLAGSPDQTSHLAAPFQAELGLGIGGRAFGVGVFGSRGFAGAGGGLYTHLTLPGPGWVHRMGVEGRIAGYESGTTAVELLWRVEPENRRTAKERRPPPPAYAPEQAPVEAPTDSAPPPADDSGATHHDDPYGA